MTTQFVIPIRPDQITVHTNTLFIYITNTLFIYTNYDPHYTIGVYKRYKTSQKYQNMFSLLLSSVLCDTTTATAAPPFDNMNMIYGVLLLLNCLVLLYAVFSKDERIKKYTRFLLLANGTGIAILTGASTFGLGLSSGVIGTILILVAYYFLCQYDLFVLIALVYNTTFLFGVVLNGVLGAYPGIVNYLLGSVFILAIVFALLAIFKFEILEKLHDVLVIHCVVAYTITTFGILSMLHPSTDNTTVAVSTLSNLILFCVLAVVVFIY